MVDILTSVLNIKSDAHLTVIEEDINQIIWHDGNPTNITNDAILAKQTELQTAYDSQAYSRNRKKEYDQLNQFEMQFDDDRDGTTTWVDTINEIKGRHPK